VLILIAHGSPRERWRDSVERMVESLQAQVGGSGVRLAYMDHTPPTLMEVIGRAVEEGADTIRVLPLFLAGEGHVTRDIRPMVEEARATYGHVEVELLPAIGQHPLFKELLIGIALQTDE
jgi:sirohydrochlorin cobaltochelatase